MTYQQTSKSKAITGVYNWSMLNRFPRKLSQLLGVEKAVYLAAGGGRHSKGLEIHLEYALTLRLLMVNKNLLPHISLTVFNSL